MRKYRDRAIKTWTQSLEMTDESSLLAQRLRQSAVSISLNLLEYEIDMAAHYLGELNSMLEAQAREAQ